MRTPHLLATVWAAVALATALWLLRPPVAAPPSTTATLTGTASPPSPIPSPNAPSSTSVAKPGPPPPSALPPAEDEPHIEIAIGNSGQASPADATPGPELGGLPLDGEELLARGLPEVQLLATTLVESGADPASLKAHLRMAYGHVQRLRQYHEFLERAEARYRAVTEQEPPVPGSLEETMRNSDFITVDRMRDSERARVSEYEKYVRRAVARDFAITNETTLEKIFQLGRRRPESELDPAFAPESLQIPGP